MSKTTDATGEKKRYALARGYHSREATDADEQKLARRVDAAKTYKLSDESTIGDEFLQLDYMSEDVSDVDEGVDLIEPRISLTEFQALRGKARMEAIIPHYRSSQV